MELSRFETEHIVILDGTVAHLRKFWNAAAASAPIVIVGGGRWARVWLSVVSAARGSCDGIVMVARTDPANLRAWIAGQTQFRDVVVAPSIAEAMNVLPAATAAIIASRPRDHVRDALQALEHGLHVLVEKPLSDRASTGHALLRAAEHYQRVLMVGTEFSFLPSLWEGAAQLALRGVAACTIRLEWLDPADEVRHGASKVRHEEVSLLTDLLPHAISIFQIFTPTANLDIVHAYGSSNGEEGSLLLCDETDRQYEFICRRLGTERRRLIQIDGNGMGVAIDFSSVVPVVTIDGKMFPTSALSTEMPSTLRLELGAFLLEVRGERLRLFSTTTARTLSRLHCQLENLLSSLRAPA